MPGCVRCTNSTKCTQCDPQLGYRLILDGCICAENTIRVGDLCIPCARF